METTPETLPQWDMTPIFPSLTSPEFESEFSSSVAAIGELATMFDDYQVRRRDSPVVDATFVQQLEAVLQTLNSLRDRLRTLGSYINCFVTTDARDETAKAYQSQLETQGVQLSQLESRLIAWLGSSDIEALLQSSEPAREHEFFIRRAHLLEKHQMNEAEENLASALRPMGLSGWAKLHTNMSALLTANVEVRGETKTLPMSAVRALSADADRAVRKAAFEAEIPAWESVSVPLAAALNGIKGFQRTVRERRGFRDDVAPTLISNSIDRETLDAMQHACIQSFPDFRRYMDAKARALGLEKLAWYDVNAPLGKAESAWSWTATENFIEENFGRYSPELAAFARRTFDERWIDAEPHVGKAGGAYCTGIRPGESRVLMNFDGSFTAVSTLAHELGHAYHNVTLAKRTALQRGLPSTLAETASIFCETLVFEAAVTQADRNERIALLDNALERNLMVVVDIHSRFLFEQSVFERRAARDLTVTELCELMTNAQRETYGEKLDPLHPYMWAVKGHYYGPTFYNYPYTFGLLFGLGLYACYRREGESFRDRYDEFLSSTGMADANTLARHFDLDITAPAFWTSSLDVIREQISEFETLTSESSN
jgi:pepF/M3 family oligoendopeptidase